MSSPSALSSGGDGVGEFSLPLQKSVSERESVFERVSVSSTIMYRYGPDGYGAVCDGMQRRAQLTELADRAARDFAAAGSSILGELATRSLTRRQPRVTVFLDTSHPMLAALEHEVILLVTTCAEDRTVAVTVNLCFSRATTDQLVALAQSIYFRVAESAIGHVRLADTTERPVRSIREIHTQLAEHLGLATQPHASSHFRCFEIRQFGGLVTALDALEKDPSGLYGILAADEGWRYVGDEAAKVRFRKLWATRNFVGVVSLGDSTLSLNLRPREYGIVANSYFERHFGRPEAYFSNEFCLAGLEHGPFLSRELTAYRHCVLQDMQARLDRRRATKLRVSAFGDVSGWAERNSLYRSLVEDLVRLRDRPPPELAGQVHVIEEDSGFPESLESLRQEVQALESEEQTLYLYRVNRVLVIVAWIGVFVAIGGVAAAVVSSLSW